MITEILKNITEYIDLVVGGNEMAAGIVLGILVSAALFVVKTTPKIIWMHIMKYTTISITINSKDAIYSDIMHYFDKVKLVNNSRFINISSGMWNNYEFIKAFGEGKQILKVFGRYVLIDVTERNLDTGVLHTLNIRYLGRSHDFIEKMRAKISNIAESDTYQLIEGDTSQRVKISNYTQAPIMSKENEEKIKLIDKFLCSRQYYLENDIPYSLGIMLHGAPGTGKTKFIKYLMNKLSYKTYIVNDLASLKKIPSIGNVLIIIEEIDTIIASRNTGKNVQSAVDLIANPLGGFLKILDGVIPTDGRIIVATTNHIDALDPALIRPGRFDITLELKTVGIEEFNKFTNKYFGKVVTGYTILDGVTGAKLQNNFFKHKSLDAMLDEFCEKITN